jgi:hypothetical protein
MKFGIGFVNKLRSQNPQTAGSLLAKDCIADFGGHSRQAFLFFTDGAVENASPLLKGVQEVLGTVFPIVGAGNSDDFLFQNMFQIFRNNVFNDSATGLILGGILTVGIGARHGWRPLGKPHIVDEASANIIKKIDGQKPTRIYEEYLGAEASSIRTRQDGKMVLLYPLGIYVEGASEYLLKNAVNVLDDGSIVCQGDVPVGGEIHIMIGHKESCFSAAKQAAVEAQKELRGKIPKIILVFESMARLKLLGKTAYQEIEMIKEVFGGEVPLVGMYTSAEVFPFQTVEKFKKPFIQNESIVVVALS